MFMEKHLFLTVINLILVWTTIDFYFGKKLSDNRKVYKRTGMIYNSEKITYTMCYIQSDFHLCETLAELKTAVTREIKRQTGNFSFI